jgi:hypothetical protein
MKADFDVICFYLISFGLVVPWSPDLALGASDRPGNRILYFVFCILYFVF